ncbi:MAG: SDR family oxidoreductase [Bernardetiaceae bacterium]|nr:SDR family oxidoreductase [Bernardetiaceae bacterium]
MKNNNIDTVLLTGATGKIGKRLIDGLVNNGYSVIFTSRNSDKIREIEAAYITQKSPCVFGIAVDLESNNLLDTLSAFFQKHDLYPQALINNARNIDYLKINENAHTEIENWLGEFKFAVTIPYELTMFLAKEEKANLQRVINIASMYGVVAPNLKLYDNPHQQSPINYGTCKAAMLHLTKELAVRLAKQNIQVNAVSYGGVEGRVNESFLNRYQNLAPQGRMLNENELYAPIRFLLSEDCTAMTGHNLNYDGGWTLW